MVQSILAGACLAVLLVCGLVFWSSASSTGGVEVRYIAAEAPLANAHRQLQQQPFDGLTVHPFFAPPAMIVVTSSTSLAAEAAPFAHRVAIGAPRLGAALTLTPSGETRWLRAFAALTGAQMIQRR